jgi:two-component system response regulator NreC
MINVFLVDDHQMFRQGLFSMLNNTEGFQVVGEASDGQNAIKNIEKLRPDIVLLDLALPVLDGIEVTRRLKKSMPKTRVLILSMHADRFFAIEALKAGANGYMLKEESYGQMLGAIRSVLKGKTFITPQLEESVMKDFIQIARHSTESPGDTLTEREREILQLITEGRTSQKIAELLFISASTVDTHRKNIMAKLDIHSVAGLVKYAIKHKIVTI